MSKLESLVPPVELCQKIPAGEFEDAALAWIHADVVGFVCRTSGCEQVAGKEWQLIRSNASRVIRARKRGEEIFPAPMLEEIMAAMQFCRVYKKTANFYVAVKEQERVPRFSGATAALELWLKLKGVEEVLNAPAESEGENE
jgi:hypothetical protein